MVGGGGVIQVWWTEEGLFRCGGQRRGYSGVVIAGCWSEVIAHVS